MPSLPSVVILNLHYTGLGIARNLRHMRVPTIGVGAHTHLPGNYSRYCRFSRGPDLTSARHDLLHFLCDIAGRHSPKPVIFPTRDLDVLFLNEFRMELEKYFLIPQPLNEVLDRILDKNKLAAVAQSLGIATPRTTEISSMDDVVGAAKIVGFPAIVKPKYAHSWRTPEIWQKVGQRKAIPVLDYRELESYCKALVPLTDSLLLQETIPGPDSNLVVYGSYRPRESHGDCYFTARKMLQYPPGLGSGIIVRAEAIPDIVEPSKALLAALSYWGVSEIEYKFDSRDNRYKLIEINPRHWDQHTLGTSLGVNLTEHCYRDLAGLPAKAAGPARSSSIWLAEQDLPTIFLRRLLKGSGPTLKDLLRFLSGHWTPSITDFRDPLPAIVAAGMSLKEITHMAFATLRKTVGHA